MSPSYQATIVRQLATFAEKGLVYKAKKSVHWCISCRTALAEAEVEYDESHVSPSIDVRFPLAEQDRDRLAQAHPALAGKRVYAVIWTTTPWTLPANLALAVHPDAEYAFYPLEGTDEVLVVAKALREASEARWRAKGNPAGAPPALGAPLAEAKGVGARAPALPPPLDRPRLPRPAGGLRHPRHRHGHRPHRPRPRLGRLPHRRPLRPRHLLPRGRGGALPARGRALRRAEGLRREPRDRGASCARRAPCCSPARTRTRTRSAGAARTRSSSARPSSGSSPSTRAGPRCASRPSRRSPSRGGFPPGARSASAT